jgi:hypothetical protein
MKHNLSHGAALSALALALLAGSAHAQVVNGGFNGLAGWSTGGDAASVDADRLVLTTASSTYQDDTDAGLTTATRNVSGIDPKAAGGGADSLEAFLGIADNALAPDVDKLVVAFEGSAASQTFAVAAGSRLSFQWDLSTLDQRDPAQADYAFIVLDGQVIRLADAFAATTAIVGGDYAAHTGWQDYTTTFDAAGSHTLSFGIVDVGDFNDTSALSVTRVAVSAVPESSTLALMVAGLAMLALKRRRTGA